MWIVDLDNLQNYFDIVLKKESDEDEYQSYDQYTNLQSGLLANNSLVNTIPALRNSNITVDVNVVPLN